MWLTNPFDRILRSARRKGVKSILIPWNRGLGDIALGLYALTERIRLYLPEAEITFVTRSDLAPGFALLKDVAVIEAPLWKRGTLFELANVEALQGKSFDLILEKVNPTKWLSWQLGKLIPRLQWQEAWDDLWKRFPELYPIHVGKLIGVHVQTETQYAYEKNWPVERWRELFAELTKEKDVGIVLFGFAKKPPFDMPRVIDLRGETTLFELLSIVKNRCSHLILPDSGVLCLTYFLDVVFPVKIISLWSDPRQGILKQNVSSPNPELVHIPLIGKRGDISAISLEEVLCLLS